MPQTLTWHRRGTWRRPDFQAALAWPGISMPKVRAAMALMSANAMPMRTGWKSR